MPAVLTGSAAERAREQLRILQPKAQPAVAPTPPAEMTELSSALALLAKSVALSMAHKPPEIKNVSDDVIRQVAEIVSKNERTMKALVDAVTSRRESIEMTITERDGDGRIKAVRFDVK